MSNPSKETLIQDIALVIAEWQDATQAFDEAVAEHLGTNLTDQRCMGVLFRRGPMTAGQLAEACGLTGGAITTALDRLEKAGYVRRMRDIRDRRRVLAELTPRAYQLIDDLWGPIAKDGQARLRRYTREQLALFCDLLRTALDLQVAHVARVRSKPRRGRISSAPDRV